MVCCISFLWSGLSSYISCWHPNKSHHSQPVCGAQTDTKPVFLGFSLGVSFNSGVPPKPGRLWRIFSHSNALRTTGFWGNFPVPALSVLATLPRPSADVLGVPLPPRPWRKKIRTILCLRCLRMSMDLYKFILVHNIMCIFG